MLRHSTAHVMAQAVTQLFPGRQVLDRPGHRERLLLRLRAARRADVQRGRPRARSRREMREIIKAEPAVRARRDVDGRGARRCSPTSRTRSRSSSASSRPRAPTTTRRRRGRRRAASISVYRNTDEFVDLCGGPHVPSTGKLGHFKLHEGRRAPTGAATRRARCCSASTARRGSRRQALDEHLHRWRRPRSATTASSPPSSTCSASRTSSAAASPCGTPRAPSCAS